MSSLITGKSKTAWLYVLLGVVVLYIMNIAKTGQTLSGLGTGIQDFISRSLSPQITPTLHFSIGGSLFGNELGQSQGNPDPSAYINTQTQYAQSQLGSLVYVNPPAPKIYAA